MNSCSSLFIYFVLFSIAISFKIHGQEHNESEWHDSNDGFVEDGNMTDGYDPGDEYAGDDNESVARLQ